MYTHQQVEVQLAQAVSLAPADPLSGSRWSAGLNPQRVRAIAATITTVTATAIITLTFKYRPTPGSASGEVTIGTLTLPIGAAVGKTYYKKGLDYKVNPGGEVVVQAAGASATGNAHLSMLVEPHWENQENNSNMIASA